VQSGYVGQRDNCRELAVLKQQLYTQELENLNQQDRNAQLLTLFGHCMYERGWTVAAPVKKARSPAEPLPGSQLQVPVTPAGQAQVEIPQSKPVSPITPYQARPIDSGSAEGGSVDNPYEPSPLAIEKRQIPVENESLQGVGVPSSNRPIQTPF
jgi:hypothetical protein